MFKIYDGRTDFYQWDLDRKLIINDSSINQVHFCNRTDECSLVCEVYEENGKRLANVPNVLLQTDWRINVYGYDKNYTKHSAVFDVIKRSRPESYVYEEEEIKIWDELDERISAIEEGGSVDVDLTDYYTKEQVDDIVNNLDVDVDLTDYYTKTQVDEKLGTINVYIDSTNVTQEQAAILNDYTETGNLNGYSLYIDELPVVAVERSPSTSTHTGKLKLFTYDYNDSDGVVYHIDLGFFEWNAGTSMMAVRNTSQAGLNAASVYGFTYGRFDGKRDLKSILKYIGDNMVLESSLEGYSTTAYVDEKIENIELTPGPQGEPGQDYVLTEEDKVEIANLVLASIPSGDEVSY